MRRLIPLLILALASSPARPEQPAGLSDPGSPAELAEPAEPASKPGQATVPVSPALSADQLLRQATASLEAGDPEIAAAIYGELSRHYPKYPSGWFGRGLAAEATGEFGLA